MSNSDHSFTYPKDKNGNYTGHSICMLVRDGQTFVGTALCSEEDHFDKKKGRELSLARALEAYTRHQAKCAANKNTSSKTKVKVSHYSSISQRYPDEQSAYEVRVKDISTSSGLSTIRKLVLRSSKLDDGWTENAFGYDRVILDEDGNGVKVTLSDSDCASESVYLDYSKLHDLHMALSLFYSKKTDGKKNGYNFQRIK